jgi:hypothetical protein
MLLVAMIVVVALHIEVGDQTINNKKNEDSRQS